jgi:hypothetical protein
MFIGVSPGWCVGQNNFATVDDISNNFDTIRDTTGYVIPYSGEEELAFLKAAIESLEPGAVSIKNQSL